MPSARKGRGAPRQTVPGLFRVEASSDAMYRPVMRLGRLVLPCLLVAGSGTGCAPIHPGAARPPQRNDEAVRVHGHRGTRGTVPPGNTVPSFRAALGYGVDVLEGDLQITAEGGVVFGHDDDLRTTGCVWSASAVESPSRISAMTDAQLAQWDCQPDVPGVQAPPHLHEVLVLDADVGFNLELKREGTSAADVYLPALMTEDEACGGCLAPRLILQSFHWADLEHVRDTYGSFDVRLSVLADEAHTTEEMNAARRYADIWSPNARLATIETIAQAHAMGFEVAPWTVNDEVEMRRLVDAEVDAIITDHPDVLLRVLGR